MPDWRRYVRQHLPPLTVGPERENEIIAELALQLEQAWRSALTAGNSEAEAERLATAQFLNWSHLGREIDAAEHTGRSRFWTGAAHDLRYAGRHLRRNPTFAAISVFTLAFGIGGNTAIFSMVDAVALRSLPYPDTGRLMSIETRRTDHPEIEQPEIEPWTSPPDFFDIREHTRAFQTVAAIDPIWNVILTGRGGAEQLQCLFVSAEFFPMLGVRTAVGRTFTQAEDNLAAPRAVVVLSHGFWQRRFGGRSDILGQSLTLDSGVFTVIGVMPPGFHYEGEPLAGTATDIDVYCPLASNPLTTGPRALRCLKVIGRLAGGVTPQQGADELRRTGAALAEQYPDTNRGYAMSAQPLRAQVTGRFRLTMLLLMGAVGFVLLMACGNVANLLLARAAARQREISVRMALGASRFRLARQLLTEGVLLAGIGGVCGLAVAWSGLRLLVAAAPASLVQGRIIHLDGRALLYTSAMVLVCAILAGLPPAWRTVRAEIGNALRDAGRGLTGGHHRLRSALVIIQVAVALVLLVGAGLLIRSFQRLLDAKPGFDAAHLVTVSTQVPTADNSPAKRTAFYQRIRQELLSVPGVREVGAVSRLPMLGMNLGTTLFVEGKSTPGSPGPDVEFRVATPSYFAAMGIALRAGRLFDEHDDVMAANILLVNRALARKYWPGENPVGKRVKLGSNPEQAPWRTVIGVVADVRHFGLDAEPRPEIYRPYASNPLGAPILVVRTAGDPALLAGTLAAKVRAVGAEVPTYNVFAMQALVDRSTAQRRFVMWLLTSFALAALLLAGVGIYGTMAQAVTQRTPEIGLRMALGATPAAALRLVFGHGLRLTLAGLCLGAVAAAGLTGLMRNLLWNVGPLDPVAFLAAAITLAGCALLACYLPARRATRVDPLIALRQE